MTQEENRFTAYKVFTDDQRFPLGPQMDASGRRFVWSYGINDGEKV